MLLAGPGRGDKQQQEQNSPNLGPELSTELANQKAVLLIERVSVSA